MQDSVISSLPKRTAIVCHDAGAANIIVAGLLTTGRKDWLAHMSGPAQAIWTEAFPDTPLCGTIEQTIQGVELLITGSGWASSVEHDARKLAREAGVKSAAVVDHWVNYSARFVRNGETVLPEEIWVTDEYAYQIALETFPGCTLVQVPNYYADAQLREIASIEKGTVSELLYILEPMRDDWGRDQPGEFQALDYFVDYLLPSLNFPTETQIRFRLHPSEPAGKYDEWISRHPELKIVIDTSKSIAQSLAQSKWVVGCESYALALALRAGRQVYCTLPPWAPPCRLPQKDILRV